MPRLATARARIFIRLLLPIVSRKDLVEKLATKPDEKASLPRTTAIRAARMTKRRGVIIIKQGDRKLVAQFYEKVR